MKKIALLFVGVLASATTFAGKGKIDPTKDHNSVSGMAVVKRDANSYKIIYKGEEASDVKVEIFNSGNTLVFSETIKKSSGFARPYNFASLAEGEYTIKIDNGSNWMTETVNYTSSSSPKLAQVIAMKDGRFMLTVGGRGEDRLAIRITDEEGKSLHSETIPVYGDFSQVYDMGALKGPFSFEVTDKSGKSIVLNK